MTPPVFITVGATEEVRTGMAVSVLGYWLRHREVGPLTVIDVGADPRLWTALEAWGWLRERDFGYVSIPRPGSQRARYVVALRAARALGAPWFVQTDDDCLPIPETRFTHGVELADLARTARARFGLRAGAPFGLVALLLTGCPFNHLVDPDHPTHFPGPPVAECGAAGGCRLMRSTIDPESLPAWEPTMLGFDCPLADHLRAQGLAVGFFTDNSPKHLRVQHLGDHRSTVWPYLAIPKQYPRDGGAEQ